jgi:hypothetical protein
MMSCPLRRSCFSRSGNRPVLRSRRRDPSFQRRSPAASATQGEPCGSEKVTLTSIAYGDSNPSAKIEFVVAWGSGAERLQAWRSEPVYSATTVDVPTAVNVIVHE